MERNHFWTFLAFGLVLGVSLEWLKHTAPEPVRPIVIADSSEITETPARRRGLIARLFKAPRQSETPASMAPIIAPVVAAVSAPTAAKSNLLKAPTKIAAKKKKKDDKKIAQVAPQMRPITPPLDDKKKSASSPELSPGSSGGVVAQRPVHQGPPRTLAEWKAYLLDTSPDYKKASELVRAYQTNQIDAEVFYGATLAMTSDANFEMRRLGLMALAATPSEASFAALVAFTETNPSAPEKLVASGYLRAYASIKNLPILTAALQASGDVNVNMQAILILRAAADQAFRSSVATRVPATPNTADIGSTPAPQPVATPAVNTAHAAVSKHYQTLAAMLTSLSHTYRTIELRQAASTTAARISAQLAANSTIVN